MRFVVGLGNPGRGYQKTPHNVGFRIVDRLVEILDPGSSRSFQKSFKAEVLEVAHDGGKILLIKPLTYMNLSGNAVRSILGYFRGGPGDLLVVHDDIDLAFGKLRFRATGSSGGHRGIESIIESFGTRDFHRLKIGVGRGAAAPAAGDEGVAPGRRDAADYVLAPFAASDRQRVEEIVERAARAVLAWIERGIEHAAGRFNGEPDGSGAPPDGDRS